jgi:hypothetical protein
LQRREFRGDEVYFVADVREPVLRGDGELDGVVQPLVVEIPDAVHFEVRHERVPLRQAPPARPGVEVDARQPEGRRDERRRGLAVRAERLAVEEDFGVELARPPALEDGV